MASLRYLGARLRGGAAVAPYLQEGMGIEARWRRLGAHWAPHIEASRAAQAGWTGEGGGTVAVIGAGRLLDFAPVVAERFGTVRFVDADPMCRHYWEKAYPGRHEAVITDVTGCMEGWSAGLASLRKASFGETLEFVRGLRAGVPSIDTCDAGISLNLLSQLVVGWQDRVKAHLIARFGSSFVDRHEEEWLAAVEPGSRSLVEGHLAMLGRSGARRILLITDLQYLDYEGREYGPERWEAPPVRWESGQWSGDGMKCTVYHALCGIEDPGEWVPGFRAEWREQWLWHIRPQGTEFPYSDGTVHLVGAFSFVAVD